MSTAVGSINGKLDPDGLTYLAKSLLSAALAGDRAALFEVEQLPPEVWGTGFEADVAEAIRQMLEAGSEPRLETLVTAGLPTMQLWELAEHPQALAPDARARDLEAGRWCLLTLDRLRSLTENGDRLSPDGLLGRLDEIVATAPRPESTTLLKPADIFGAKDPPPPLFQHGPPRGTLAVIGAPSAQGKSFVCLELAATVATGRVLLPTFKPLWPDKPGKVIYLAYEDSASIIRDRLLHRIDRIEQGLGDAIAVALKDRRLQFICEPPALSRTGSGRVVSPTPAFRELERLIEAERPDLVVIDPLSGAAELAEENSNSELGAVARALAELAAKHDTVVMLVHHSSKARAEDPSQHMLRGGSALACRARWIATLHKPTSIPDENVIELTVVKTSYARPPDPVLLRRGPGGELTEAPRPEVSPVDLARAIAEWLTENPDAQVTAGGLSQNRGDHNKACRTALLKCFPWLRNADIEKAVSQGKRSGILREVEETNPRNRKKLAALRPVAVASDEAEDDEDDVPF